MIEHYVLNELYYFMSADEWEIKILAAVSIAAVIGIYFGWLITYAVLDGKRKKEKINDYLNTLSDREYRNYFALKEKLK